MFHRRTITECLRFCAHSETGGNMFRLTIYVENAWLELGIQAVVEFHRAFGNGGTDTIEIDALQRITADTLARFEKMQTVPNWGFTPEYKETMLTVLRKNEGKFMLVTKHFGHNKKFMRVVELLNQGKSIDEVQALLETWHVEAA